MKEALPVVAGADQQTTQQTRARIVRAARVAFASQGYAGASMRNIAAEAGVTAMALYTYAPSKRALFQLVYDEVVALLYAEYNAAVAGKRSLLEEVQAVLDLAGQQAEQDPGVLHFMLRFALDHEHEELRTLGVATDAYVAFFRRLADRAVRRGEIARRDTTRMISFVTILLWGISAEAALEPDKVGDAVETAKWAADGRLG